VTEHLLVVGHVWHLSWEAIWRLPYHAWCQYAAGAEEWSKESKAQAKTHPKGK
jgi:hypothetical protein